MLRATLLLLALPLTAHATQSAPVTDYSGTYDLACASAALTLDLGLSWNGPGGSGSWGDTTSAPLACTTPVAALARWAGRVEASCRTDGLPRRWCASVATGLYQAVLPFADVGVTTMPDRLELTAQNQGGLDALLGVYNAWGWHTWADGRAQGWSYLLDNNDGPEEGHLVALGVTLQGAAAIEGAGCIDTSIAAVDGQIFRDQGFDLDATFAINRSLTCAAVLPDGTALGLTLGITFEGAMTGARVP